MLRRVFDFFLFSSFYIAFCAVVMVLQTNHMLQLDYDRKQYLFFVFFSTICSYNFNWFLTPVSLAENARLSWTGRHRKWMITLIFLGGLSSAYFAFQFIDQWPWLGLAVLLTFLYSAPKIQHSAGKLLQKIAIGKTLFLTFVWTYVTTILPIIFGAGHWNISMFWFILGRFFLIYAICIIFDYRDRENDRREKIRSMITWFSERGVNTLFYVSLAGYFLTVLLTSNQYSAFTLLIMFVPGLLTAFLYPLAKRNNSDYLYYFVLDGLMMLSGLLLLLVELVKKPL